MLLTRLNSLYNVGNTQKLFDKPDGRLARYGLIENSAKDRFCLFFVGNHITFDGSTIYNLWKMLDESQQVTSLNPVRSATFHKSLSEDCSLLPTGIDAKSMNGLFLKSYIPAVLSKGVAQTLKGCNMRTYRHPPI